MSIVKKSLALGFWACAVLILLSGCLKGKSQKTQEINLAIWSNYVEPSLLEKFTAQTGFKVNISNYTSNEELLAKIQAGSSGIDVAVPSDYMVSIMIKLNLLQELDSQRIPNRDLIASEFLNLNFDPQNQFSLPYAWGAAGIAVNRELFKDEVKGWKDIFQNKELSGKLSLLDDVREVTAAALKMHGYSVNTVKKEELKQAQAALIAVKPRVKMFRSDALDALLKKEVAVAQVYSTDGLMAARKSEGKIEFILPEEGGTWALDTLVILKSARNREGAHKLINFLLSSDVNLSFVKNMLAGPVLKNTREKLPVDLRKNPALFPAKSVLSKLESIVDLGEATRLYDEIWTIMKTQ